MRNAGHGLMYQYPNEFNRVKMTFLRDNSWMLDEMAKHISIILSLYFYEVDLQLLLEGSGQR